MPRLGMSGISFSTNEEAILDLIGEDTTGIYRHLRDTFATRDLFSGTIGTAAGTTSGGVVDVSKSSSQTIAIDLTGAGSATPTITIYGTCTGVGAAFTIMRVITASADQSLFFKLKSDGNNTGVVAGQTGITRVNGMWLQVQQAGTGTSTSFTVEARAMLSPEF